jgi:hypothetical protein
MAVAKFDSKGKFIKEYSSYRDADNLDKDINRKTLSRIVKDFQPFKGYYWRSVSLLENNYKEEGIKI